MRKQSRSWKLARMPSPRASFAEMVWLVEHPPLYTAGTSAQDADLVDA